MMTYAEELIREGRQEGRQEGQVATIESFLRAGVGWPIIKQATGIDQDARLSCSADRPTRQLGRADSVQPHPPGVQHRPVARGVARQSG